MYSYILILIFTGQYVATSVTIPQASLELCEANKKVIVDDYVLKNPDTRRAPALTAHCVKVD